MIVTLIVFLLGLVTSDIRPGITSNGIAYVWEYNQELRHIKIGILSEADFLFQFSLDDMKCKTTVHALRIIGEFPSGKYIIYVYMDDNTYIVDVDGSTRNMAVITIYTGILPNLMIEYASIEVGDIFHLPLYAKIGSMAVTYCNYNDDKPRHYYEVSFDTIPIDSNSRSDILVISYALDEINATSNIFNYDTDHKYETVYSRGGVSSIWANRCHALISRYGKYGIFDLKSFIQDNQNKPTQIENNNM